MNRLELKKDRAASNAAVSALIDRECLDDLSRQVFGVMGLPVDALDLPALLQTIKTAAGAKTRFLLSTPNVNFLMMSRSDATFRESLLMSDVCTIDGMPLIWIARLLGIPIKVKLSGSDIFDALRSRKQTGQRINVFLLGGADNIAETVCNNLNHEDDGLRCVGTLNPGYGTIEEMSTDGILHTINSSDADFLSVFLSARKAQAWLLRNHDCLQIPVRAQFGAAVNLQAGTIKRAPKFLRSLGFEWLWRIKEEPYLWRRYWNDGWKLAALLVTRVVPLSIAHFWRRLVGLAKKDQLAVDVREDSEATQVKLTGAAVLGYIDLAIPCFREALDAERNILVDVTDTTLIDARFFGLFLMVRKQLVRRGRSLDFCGLTPNVKKMFRLNGFAFLLDAKS